jgi:large subunit ribosomal protein L32
MPNPKRRHSKQRTAKRRTHYKAIAARSVVCPQCQAAKLSHIACSECGYYNGRRVLATA